MSKLFQDRLQSLKTPESYMFLTNIQRGIEKEGLRVTPQSMVAQTPHPNALGSALTHPCITTDYSEALLEFITPVFSKVKECLDHLSYLHNFTLRQLDNEHLWPASMPCKLEGDTSIPIARYGKSNQGQLKYIYRQGLAHRYGRTMQSIAGIHYNFSMPEKFWPYYQKICGENGNINNFRSEKYFDLIRNFRRHSWLLIYLFGASPTLDNSFITSKKHNLDKLGKNTLGLSYATSLRMSDLGYQSEAQNDLNISYDNLDSYITDLTLALNNSYPDYEKIGVNVNGEYRQLNTNILQSENEYYSEIRPKRITKGTEKPIDALLERGVEYIEVRILDINPFLPVGINEEQIHFLDAFLLYCLLSDSPKLTKIEEEEIKNNQKQIILDGRRPELMLKKNGENIDFKILAKNLLNEIRPIVDLFDEAFKSKVDTSSNNEKKLYMEALLVQFKKVENSELTPSNIIMENTKNDFIGSMLLQAKKHRDYFLLQPQSTKKDVHLQDIRKESIQKQQKIEEVDKSSLDAFLPIYS